MFTRQYTHIINPNTSPWKRSHTRRDFI